MAIDLSRVATKAIEAALEDGHDKRRHGSTVRALAAGAALAVGARAAMSKTPGPAKLALQHLPGLSELRDMPDRIRDRMTDAGWLDDEEPVQDEPEAYEDDEEPEAEAEPDADDDFDEEEDDVDDDDDDEDLDDEDVDDEPEAEADEDFDDEELEEDEDEEDEEEPAPELELEPESEDDDDLHPEDRPPKPPRSKSKA